MEPDQILLRVPTSLFPVAPKLPVEAKSCSTDRIGRRDPIGKRTDPKQVSETRRHATKDEKRIVPPIQERPQDDESLREPAGEGLVAQVPDPLFPQAPELRTDLFWAYLLAGESCGELLDGLIDGTQNRRGFSIPGRAHG